MFVRRLASQIGQASPPFSPSPQFASRTRCRPSTSRCQSKHKASNRWAGAYLLTARDAGLGMLAKPQGPTLLVQASPSAKPKFSVERLAQAFPAKWYQKVPSLGLPASPGGAQVRWTLKKHPASLRGTRAGTPLAPFAKEGIRRGASFNKIYRRPSGPKRKMPRGSMPERLKGADCKSAGDSLRWFESSSTHYSVLDLERWQSGWMHQFWKLT